MIILAMFYEWAKVLCSFHDDHHPSLSINLQKGYFKCHSCHAKGGGITKFNIMKNNLSFQETIKQLEGVRW
jgi:DNA primase